MPAPLSIIIPTLNAASTLPFTVSTLLPGLDSGLIRELVIVDGGSSDNTTKIADELGARYFSSPKGRGTQLRRGASEAYGDWFLFLHADTALSEQWPEVCKNHMIDTPDQAGFFQLAFDRQSPGLALTSGWANFRSRHFGLPYGDQGLLVSRRHYERVGGYADVPLMEDVRIAHALRPNLRMLDATATTSAARYQRRGWLLQGGRNLSVLALYKFGVSETRLARFYQS